MTNAWSFLYDELKMDELDLSNVNLSDTYPVPAPVSSDTITLDGVDYSANYDSFTCAELPSNYLSFDLNTEEKSKLNKYKYSEDVILKELKDYITGTYNQHYSAGDDKIQTLDLIEACGDGESFCRSNILKYASRYDKKGTARRDIMKILHYAVLLMHFNDKNAKRETYPQ
jgi:hypothetical protein